MKTALSSFDLRALVAEWQDLVGGHVDKAYQRGDEVILRINAPVRGKAELFYQAGRWLCVHEVETKPETPPPFAQTLRRLLDNARVRGIEQRGFDRIAVFHLERSGESNDLVFEVFGKGNLVVVKGATIDATPIELLQYRDLERREFPTLNEALSHYLTVAEPEMATVEDVPAKFERRIAQQRESLDALREDAVRLEAQAVFLYGHYAVFDELLKAIREGRTPPEHAQIKSIDRKAHTVTLAIGDFDAITLEYDNDVTANAQALYDRRKDALMKAQRVEEAIAATRTEIESAQAKAIKVAKRPRVKATKSMWFEAYRWPSWRATAGSWVGPSARSRLELPGTSSWCPGSKTEKPPRRNSRPRSPSRSRRSPARCLRAAWKSSSDMRLRSSPLDPVAPNKV